MNDVLLVLAAVVAGWGVQLWLTYRQSIAFNQVSVALKRYGAVAVGQAGRRYRGGVAFVAIATDGRRVTAAQTLRGWTTFARPRPLPVLEGRSLAILAGSREVDGLRDNEREAVRQAAQTLRATRAAPSTPADPRTTQ